MNSKITNPDKLVFITELQDSSVNGSSTQIVSDLYLRGFLDLGKEVHLIGIIDPIENPENIRNQYEGLVSSLTLVPSELFLRGTSSKLGRLFALYKFLIIKSVFPGKWRKLKFPTGSRVVFSCCPSIEVSLISTFLVRTNPNVKNIQMWSDPVFWSGANPYKVNVKKLVLYPLEAIIYLRADRIILQSPVMLKIQSRLFPFIKFRGYVHLPANPKLAGPKPSVLVAYIGNADPKIRDISGFVAAAKKMSSTQFLIVTTIFDVAPSSNIRTISSRISSQEAFEYEKMASVLVVLLNHTTPQIPGKVFYYIGAGVPVLVIVDGPFGAEIQRDLERYPQLYFCRNVQSDIVDKLSYLVGKNIHNQVVPNNPQVTCGAILNVE